MQTIENVKTTRTQTVQNHTVLRTNVSVERFFNCAMEFFNQSNKKNRSPQQWNTKFVTRAYFVAHVVAVAAPRAVAPAASGLVAPLQRPPLTPPPLLRRSRAQSLSALSSN